MPYSREWIPNELFYEHGGVRIYHSYKDDEIENGPFSFWFTLDDNDSYDDAFDVRALSCAKGKIHNGFGDETEIKAVLREAIDLGLLKNPDE